MGKRIVFFFLLTLFLLVSFADNFCKQFGPRLGLTKRWPLPGSNLFDTQMVFLKEFFEKVDFEKKTADDKKHEKIPIQDFISCSQDFMEL